MRFGPNNLLGGYVLGSGARVVVLAHQSAASSCQMLPLARRLSSAGYRVLAFDATGYGSSTGSTGAKRTRADDVAAAVEFVRAQGAAEVYLLGASMGGYAVLGAAMMLRSPVNAVVSLSAPAVFADGDKEVNVTGFPSPLLLFTARNDSEFLRPNETFARQDPTAELHVVPGFDHGVDLVDHGVLAKILAFLRAN